MLSLDRRLKSCLAQIAVNLLGYLSFTDSLLSFAFALLNRRSYRSLRRFVNSLVPENKKERLQNYPHGLSMALSDAPFAAYESKVKPYLDEIRNHIDKLELVVDNEIWPLPKYRELLFTR